MFTRTSDDLGPIQHSCQVAAVGAGVHRDGTADRSRNAGQKLKARQSSRGRMFGHQSTSAPAVSVRFPSRLRNVVPPGARPHRVGAPITCTGTSFLPQPRGHRPCRTRHLPPPHPNHTGRARRQRRDRYANASSCPPLLRPRKNRVPAGSSRRAARHPARSGWSTRRSPAPALRSAGRAGSRRGHRHPPAAPAPRPCRRPGTR